MSLRLQALILVICVIILLYFVDMIRKDKISLKYALPWLTALAAVMLLVVSPQFITWFARLLGVATPMNAIFFITILMMLMFIFLISLSGSRNAQRVVRLVQEVALLKKELADQDRNRQQDENYT